MKSTNLALVPTEARSSSMKDRLLDAMSGSFKRLFTEAPDASPHSPGGTAPKNGAYGKPIYYLSDGTVLHSCSVKMKELRPHRKLTQNAVELSCPALGLAVYVSSTARFHTGNTDGRAGTAAVRVVVYDHESLAPTETEVVGSPAQLLDALHLVLVMTYNRLSREYNLAGFRQEWLCLCSERPDLIPNIPLALGA